MARIRTVKPEFWGHRKTAKVSRDARLLFLGLLNEADDEGRLLGSSKKIAGNVYPNDDDVTEHDIDEWLTELAKAMFIIRYRVDGITLVQVIGFTEHQKVSHPSPSKLPPPPDSPSDLDFCVAPEALPNNSGDAPETFVPDLGTGNREQGTARAEPSSKPALHRSPRSATSGGHGIDERFDEAWRRYPRKVAKAEALKAWRARRRAGVPADELVMAAANYADACEQQGKTTEHIMHGSTFFGPSERWKDYLPDGAALAEVHQLRSEAVSYETPKVVYT